MKNLEVIYISPLSGSGGVGDFSQVVLDYLHRDSNLVLNEIRTTEPGGQSLVELFKLWKRLRELEQTVAERLIIADLSAGSVVPFWLVGLSRRSKIVCVVHDPEWAVWWPFRFKSLAKRRFLNHLIHYPLRPITKGIERKVLAKAKLVALSAIGEKALARNFPSNGTYSLFHFLWEIPAPFKNFSEKRVGLFGYVYKSKGFEIVDEFRNVLRSDVEIVIGGRGTFNITSRPGVTVLGEIDESQLANFFKSLECLFLPYSRRSRYGTFVPASGVLARALSFGTPTIAFSEGTFLDESLSKLLLLAHDATSAAAQVDRLLSEDSLKISMAKEMSRYAATHQVSDYVHNLFAVASLE